MFYHSDKLVSTNVIFSTILNIFHNACLGYIVHYTFVRRSSFNVLQYIPAFPLLLVLVALPSVVKANIDELDINGTMASLTGATAAAVAGGAMSSAMDSVEKFTMKDMKWSPEDIASWSPTHRNSIIHIIVIRMSPGTTEVNDGLAQIIACILLVWLLNLWGEVLVRKNMRYSPRLFHWTDHVINQRNVLGMLIYFISSDIILHYQATMLRLLLGLDYVIQKSPRI